MRFHLYDFYIIEELFLFKLGLKQHLAYLFVKQWAPYFTFLISLWFDNKEYSILIKVNNNINSKCILLVIEGFMRYIYLQL